MTSHIHSSCKVLQNLMLGAKGRFCNSALYPYLCHLFPVGLRVEGGLCQKDGVLLWGDTKLVVEGVMPDLLHIVPVGYDTVLNRVLQGEDTSLALCFVSNVAVLLSHTNHDTLVTGPANYGWEDSPWGIVSGESGFHHSGPVVDDKSGNIFVTHDD